MTDIELMKAARALVAKGWCQRVSRDGDRYCVWGAIEAVTSTSLEADRLYGAFRDYGIKGKSITVWNDARGRTQEQVLAAFDRAIEGMQN
jgi:hypothetical protein